MVIQRKTMRKKNIIMILPKIAIKINDYSNLTKIWNSRSTYYEAKNDSVNAMKCYENSNFHAKNTNFIELATNFTNFEISKRCIP